MKIKVICPGCRHSYLFPEKKIKKEEIRCDHCNSFYIRSECTELNSIVNLNAEKEV